MNRPVSTQKKPPQRGPMGGGPGRHGMMSVEKAKDFKGSIKKLVILYVCV